jgi:hypothetical protein
MRGTHENNNHSVIRSCDFGGVFACSDGNADRDPLTVANQYFDSNGDAYSDRDSNCDCNANLGAYGHSNAHRDADTGTAWLRLVGRTCFVQSQEKPLDN